MMDQSFPAPTPRYSEALRFAEEQLAVPSRGGLREVWRRLADFGFFRMPFLEEIGGVGLSPDELCDIFEGLGAGDADNGLLFAAGAHLWAVAKPLAGFGSAGQKERWLQPLLEGTIIGAHAASEPEAGSDVMSMTSRYTQVDGGYVLNGVKVFVTNAPLADLFVVFATCDPRLHFRGITAFLLERSNPGLRVGPAEEKMGLQSACLAAIYLDNCFVPTEALLGRERRGARIFQTTLAWERTFIQAHQVGVMRRQIGRVSAHARERRQFGSSIAKFQSVSNRIVEMYVRYWQARLILRMAAAELMQRGDSRFAAMVKLVLAESALATHLEALRTFGGSGYMCEMGIEREVRDSIGGVLYSGTSDVQRNIIAADLGL
ncbi:MAG TPA: acyl-CoA dehydrogenase family protein [Thermoanaerobaculia bacterium]|nr:acyl-CoA dehydrogenase family protein [Thermoanaerobaculia bacterium]